MEILLDMKINLELIDRDSFNINTHSLNGESVYLVTPKHLGVIWNRENRIFRSSLWNSNGELISASYPKFFNWGERSDISPTPNSLIGCSIVEKLDGSLLCLTKYRGEVILRTRGTVDARKLNNGFELESFQPILDRLLRIYESNGDTWKFSLLFEWLSPSNVIVLRYGDQPQFRLIGGIDHKDYSLFSQNILDNIADTFGVDRPKRFTFTSIENLLTQVRDWKGMEGVCVYSKDGQEIHKIKGEEYLKLHAFKENVSLENTVDLFCSFGYPSYPDFEKKLVETFDYECFDMVRGFASQVVDAFKTVKEIESGMIRFVEPLKGIPRKDAALKILSDYGETNRASFAFLLLDGKTLGVGEYKKLLWQCLKK
jgi:hypothetical protein